MAERGRRSARRGALALVVGCAALVGIAGGVAFHVARGAAAAPAAPALPELHGQAVWAAGARPAPAFALHDQDGRLVSLRSLRGRPVALTFLDSRCREQCPLAGRALSDAVRRLASAERPTLIVVSIDPAGDTPRSIRASAAHWGFAGRWHWLRGNRAQLARVWRAYKITVEPRRTDIVHSAAVYLIDRRGDERAGYLFPFLPGFVSDDLRTLAHERGT